MPTRHIKGQLVLSKTGCVNLRAQRHQPRKARSSGGRAIRSRRPTPRHDESPRGTCREREVSRSARGSASCRRSRLEASLWCHRHLSDREAVQVRDEDDRFEEERLGVLKKHVPRCAVIRDHGNGDCRLAVCASRCRRARTASMRGRALDALAAARRDALGKVPRTQRTTRRSRRSWRSATTSRRSLLLSGSAPSGRLLVPLERRDVRVVEGARLESVCRGNSTEGSNPSLSASLSTCK